MSAHSHYSFFAFAFLPYVPLGAGAAREVTAGYSSEPRKTMPAPVASCAFQPFPNHHTLKQRLIALRVVSTRFVDTDETCCCIP